MKKLSIILLAAVVISGCSKNYFDINQNPNTTTNASVDLVLANALKVTAGQLITSGAYQTVTEWMNYWAPSGSYAINASDGASYKQTTDFADPVWTADYRNLEDYDYIERTATAANNYFYIAAAKTMKAFVYGQLVDMFNNVPYSEALKGTANLTPKYDDAKSIYEDLEIQLKAAIVLFKRADAVGNVSQDIMFGTNPLTPNVNAAPTENPNWIRFANSLRLRLLIRQSQVAGRSAYIQTEINDIIANGGGFLTADASVNPGYSNSSGKQSPFYGFIINTAGTYVQDFWRANKYPITFCQAHNDIRYTRWYAPVVCTCPTNGQYIGNIIGASNVTGNAVGSQSSTFGPGLVQSVSQAAIIFTAAESYFLQAEAILKGFMAGSAQAAFNSGVQSSFTYLGAGSSATYTAQAGDNQVNYAACSTDAQRLACIIRQKYLAFNTTTPLEAWADYRRLGLPADLPLSIHPQIDPLGSNIPTRFSYVYSEYQTNVGNVPGVTNYHTGKIFWMP